MFQAEESVADTTAVEASGVSTDLSILKSMSVDELISKLAHDIVSFFISVAIAVFVFYIGKFIIRKLYGFVAGVMIRRKVDQSLSTFVLSMINIVLYFILLVTVISILGINTSSFIALFASAGVAIGMALSGTLQNFAGGVLILLLKPYKIGDYIETQGYAGTVTEIQIFSTIICTPDNKSIIIPNGGLSTGTINNWSREDYRRVEWTVSLAYGDDVETAKAAILDILNRQADILKTDIPTYRTDVLKHTVGRDDYLRGANRGGAPTVALSALASSSIDFTVRAWVSASQYWSVYYAVNEALYRELPERGLNFPFPQMDVHIQNPQA